MNIPSHYMYIVRYGIVGVCGGAIQTSMLYLWVDILHLETYYLLGTSTGFCLALGVTFTLQKYWTFKDSVRENIKKQFYSYTIIAIINLGLNVFLLHLSKTILEMLGLNFFQTWYLIAQVLIVGILAACSFVANYTLTFSRKWVS